MSRISGQLARILFNVSATCLIFEVVSILRNHRRMIGLLGSMNPANNERIAMQMPTARFGFLMGGMLGRSFS
jgi:hypothetical protein